jgi:magnesium transporter
MNTVAPTGCSIRGRVWRGGESQPDFDFDRISDYLTEPDTLAWVDMCEPDHDALCELADELNLSHWAVEDAIAPSERVKATIYPAFTFFTVYAVDMAAPATDPDPSEITTLLTRHRISAFVLTNVLVTVRLAPPFDIEKVSQRWDELGTQRFGVAGLVHGLLDVVVDGQFDAVQVLDDCIEGLEDELFEPSPRGTPGRRTFQRRSFQLRKDLVHLRRVVLPMREVVGAIQHRRPDTQHPPDLDPLFIDLYDHVLRVSEWTESLRDMVTTVFETNLSLQDARLNTVMKKLTGWAAIVAVPTAITGFYGQNVPYPGYELHWGFVVSTGITVVLVLVLYVMFKLRDWL